MNGDGADDSRASMLAVYAQVGENYRAMDDVRLRLLALLPLATGAGVLVLLGGHSVAAAIGVPVGVFGMVATISLYTRTPAPVASGSSASSRSRTSSIAR